MSYIVCKIVNQLFVPVYGPLSEVEAVLQLGSLRATEPAEVFIALAVLGDA